MKNRFLMIKYYFMFRNYESQGSKPLNSYWQKILFKLCLCQFIWVTFVEIVFIILERIPRKLIHFLNTVFQKILLKHSFCYPILAFFLWTILFIAIRLFHAKQLAFSNFYLEGLLDMNKQPLPQLSSRINCKERFFSLVFKIWTFLYLIYMCLRFKICLASDGNIVRFRAYK